MREANQIGNWKNEEGKLGNNKNKRRQKIKWNYLAHIIKK